MIIEKLNGVWEIYRVKRVLQKQTVNEIGAKIRTVIQRQVYTAVQGE